MRFVYTGKESGNPEDGRGDALWLVLRDGEYEETGETADRIIAHHDRDGGLLPVGIYADASNKVDLTQINSGGMTGAAWASKQHV